MSVDNKNDETQKSEDFLKLCESPEELRDWIFTYLDLDLPIGHVDPDSNSSPSEWLYEAYATIRDNGGDEIPAYIILSSRDSYKTLSASILEVLAIVHFQLTVSHMAAIKPQSAKAIQYINNFFRKIRPYMEHHQLKFKAENKSNIQVEDKHGDIAYVVVIVCTLQGANCIGLNNKIKTDKGEMSAIDVYNCKEDVKFLSFDHKNNALEYKEVIHKFDIVEKELILVEVDDNILEVSPDHQFFVEGKGYVTAENLTVDDIVLLEETEDA